MLVARPSHGRMAPGGPPMVERERRVAYQTPITIKKALERIHARQYVLPAIQREFVWRPDQVCQLFDSLLRGYPIGAFLFWNVTPERSREFVFYEVMTRYHERDCRHCERLALPEPRSITAILDGQQRLTSLNIGLNGSYAARLARKWRTSAGAYPAKELFLDLCHAAPDDELAMHYRFEFLAAEQAREASGPDAHWYRVRDVMDLPEGAMPLLQYVMGSQIAEAGRPRALETLDRLRRAVHDEGVIAFHEEDDQDLDRVLNIFIRVNSAGTTLSSSDLLLSVATAQWTGRDAREAITQLVDALNQTGQGFRFDKDLVLKAGLVMTDAGGISFKVMTFNQANMARLEANWERIESALRIGVRLLASFGLSERTLAANSVLVPIADYLYQRGPSERFLNAKEHREDREAIRGWVVRSLLKGGVWGSGLDTLLLAIRRAMREDNGGRFPVEPIEAAMARRGKALTFSSEEVDELLDSPYGKPRTFALLATMYTGIDVRNEFHVDHVFPKSLFTPARLRAVGIPDERIDDYRTLANSLANLQLLEGAINTSKQATMPGDWARSRFADDEAVGLYLAGHDLHGLPEDLETFDAFCSTRRERMRRRLSHALADQPQASPDEPASVDAQPSQGPRDLAEPADTPSPVERDGHRGRGARLQELPVSRIADLDDAIVQLIRDSPGKLGQAMPAHILWGSKGPATIKAGWHAHRDYGRFKEVLHADLLQRVHELVAAGRLQLAGEPRVLTPVEHQPAASAASGEPATA